MGGVCEGGTSRLLFPLRNNNNNNKNKQGRREVVVGGVFEFCR